MLGANDMEEIETNENGYYKPRLKRDDMDLVMLAMGRLRLTRCNGGRRITKSNICDHCGIDMEDNPNFCGQPVKDDGYTTFDATIAQRILRDSAQQYEGE